MSTKSSSNNTTEHQQTPAGLIESNQDELATADKVNDAEAKKNALLELNKSAINELEKVVKDDPSVDLLLRLREVARNYRTERKAFIGDSHSQIQDEGV